MKILVYTYVTHTYILDYIMVHFIHIPNLHRAHTYTIRHLSSEHIFYSIRFLKHIIFNHIGITTDRAFQCSITDQTLYTRRLA